MEQGPTEWSNRLQDIMSHPVTVETIATYPEVVTAELIALIGIVKARHIEEIGVLPDGNREAEDAAFAAYDLPPLSGTLSVIQQRIDHVREARRFLTEDTLHVDRVISPPDRKSPVVAASGKGYEFTVAELKDRMQTALFVLQQMGIPLSEIKVTEGDIDANMVRQTSYFTIEVPAFDKVIQICDEENNASYIFSLSKLIGIGISVKQLDGMTKQEKNELIALHQKRSLGLRFIYGAEWSERLMEYVAAGELPFEMTMPLEENAPGQVVPPAPANYRAVTIFAKEKRLNKKYLDSLIEREGLTLPIKRFGSQTTRALSPAAQTYLELLPELNFVLPDETVVSVKRFAIEIGLSRDKLDELIARYGIPTQVYKFSSKTAPGLTQEAQDAIRGLPELAVPIAGDDVESVAVFAEKKHVNAATMKRIMEELEISAKQYKFVSQITVGLTDDQRRLLETHPYINTPFATVGIDSVNTVARRLQSSVDTVRRYMQTAGIRPGNYRFNTKIAEGLTEEQVGIVETLLKQDRPSDATVVSIESIRHEYKLAHETMQQVLADNGIQTVRNMFRTIVADGVTPDMAARLRTALDARIRSANDDEKSVSAFADELGRSEKTIRSALDELGVVPSMARFRSTPGVALNPEHREAILRVIEEREANRPRDDEVSIGLTANILGMNMKTVYKIADELGIVFEMRFSAGQHRAYTTSEMRERISSYRDGLRQK